MAYNFFADKALKFFSNFAQKKSNRLWLSDYVRL